MDDALHVSLTIGVGILIGLIYARRTGWSAGGLVTPGLLALQVSNPYYFGGALGVGIVIACVLRPFADRLGLYGRERVGAGLLIAIFFRVCMILLEARGVALSGFGLEDFWIGWIAPGLIACDIDRQGAVMTISAAATTGIATALVVYSGAHLWGLWQ